MVTSVFFFFSSFLFVFSNQGKISSCNSDLLLKRMRGQVCPTRKYAEEEKVCALSLPFMLPGKVIRAEWEKSSSLGENQRQDHYSQINLRAKQKFEILSATTLKISRLVILSSI